MHGHGRSCGESRGFGPPWARFGHRHGGGGFGIRRPLRFLAHKLELDEDQVREAAAILGELKTERAQAGVDNQRAKAAFADAFGSDSFDAEAAAKAGEQRAATAARVNAAVVTALGKLHALLDEEQRKQLALLLRTGPLSI